MTVRHSLTDLTGRGGILEMSHEPDEKSSRLIIDENDAEDDIEFDGDMLRYQGQPFTGTMQAHHINHVLAGEWEYLNGFTEGLCREWYDNGQLSEECHSVRGLMEGKGCEWHKNGVLKSVSHALHGVRLEVDEWDDAGLLIKHWVIDKESALYRHALSLPRMPPVAPDCE
jgi:antitoxin component YwqK of YwqJK toxin-antitoxin module